MALSLEAQALIVYAAQSGVPHRVTATTGRYVSASNPCSPHSPGSYHCKPGTDGTGLAIDLAEPTASSNTPGLLAIFNAFKPVESKLAELIYSGASYSIKDGKRVPRYAVSSHWNHVHVAVPKGTLLVPLSSPPKGSVMPDYEVVAEPVSISVTPSGQGYLILCKDGGVFAFGDAVYLGRVHVKP